jgi:membrane-associated protease RseP (regulator of RpoE activity)
VEGEEKFRNVKSYYGVLTMLKTKKGLSLLDKVGSFRIDKPLAWFMLYLMPVAGGAALWLILNTLSIYLSPQGAVAVAYIKTISPLGNLLIPGINPYVPILYGWIALVVAVFIHEASHGIVARSLGLPVKSAGIVFLLFIPIGAFVELDDQQLKIARGRDTARVLAAGSGINVILAFIALALLILSVSTMVPVVQGAAITGVQPNTAQLYSPANVVGIQPGDFITAINNKPVTDLTSLFGSNNVFKPGESINITLWRNGQTIQRNSVMLGQITYIDLRTNKTSTYAFLGVNQIGYQDLQGIVSAYTTQFTKNLIAYMVLPTLPLPNQRINTNIPYSDAMIVFYRSSLGPALPFVTNLLFWIWFVNINLAIFNCLPIYPMDGGQLFEIAVRSIGRGRISEGLAGRITTVATVIIAAILVAVVVGPYLSGLLF